MPGDAAAETRAAAAIAAALEHAVAVRSANDTLRDNEQTKLTATYLNGLANAFFSAGVLAPLLGLLVPGNPYASHPAVLALVAGGCFLLSVAIHMLGRKRLERLRA